MIPLLATRPDLRSRTTRAVRGLASSLLILSLSLGSSDARSVELRTVLENTTVAPPARVEFYEERHNQMFQEPMLLTGYLEYLEAGVLRKVVETPFRKSFLIRDDFVFIERNGESQKLSLKKSKSLKTILGAIEAILAGETDKLESVFRYELSGTEALWSVELSPISRRIARRLTALSVEGDDQSITSIRIDLKDGEWHMMEIGNDIPEP